MATQRTVVVANDSNENNDVDIAAGTVARQPSPSDHVKMDYVVQPTTGNENGVILIPEAMIDGTCRFTC